MQNTYQTQVPASISKAAAVVKNDTSAVSSVKTSIKVGTNAKVTVGKKSDSTTPLQRLQSMETATRNWEANELAASNKRLYSILTDAYSFYQTLKGDPIKETRLQYATDLEEFIAQRKYLFAPTSHDMTRVVKCVFGADRRRVSAYSIALREALRQDVTAKDLADFIEQNGGVEQIRLGGTKPLSAKVRAGKVKDEVLGAELGTIKFDARLVGVDADWADKQVVIVATYLPTGEFKANAVIRHDSAVNAALAAYYSKQQAADRASKKEMREADKEAAVNLKKATAADNEAAKKSAVSLIKEERIEKQKVKAAMEKAAEERAAANIAHTATLFEEVQA
jgi:hypothetical protein